MISEKNWRKLSKILAEEDLNIEDLPEQCFRACKEYSGIGLRTPEELETLKLRWTLWQHE